MRERKRERERKEGRKEERKCKSHQAVFLFQKFFEYGQSLRLDSKLTGLTLESKRVDRLPKKNHIFLLTLLLALSLSLLFLPFFFHVFSPYLRKNMWIFTIYCYISGTV